ncbi:hypothetical protein EYF80_021401 [Liparis tanakae]|uniref:Uncharacterized protein n=1 Tax=Liparis tanakae TaxID=230148 RepID=A0A4Z2HRH8_9TELE|nr:hypothetical protein EYF80_021401 [Liparis tanakae]
MKAEVCGEEEGDSRSTNEVKSMRKRLRRLFSSAHIRTTPTPLSSITSLATVLQNLALRFSMALLPSYTATKFFLHSLECSIWYSMKRRPTTERVVCTCLPLSYPKHIAVLHSNLQTFTAAAEFTFGKSLSKEELLKKDRTQIEAINERREPKWPIADFDVIEATLE